MKFYECGVCGKVVAVVKGEDTGVICCWMPMHELVLGKKDDASRRQIPANGADDGLVSVAVGAGETRSPRARRIEWIAIETADADACGEDGACERELAITS